MKRIYRFIAENKLLDKNDTVLAAVSGGPDSMLLLRVLTDLAVDYNLSLQAIHINHQLRGAIADEETQFVADMCASWKIPCRIIYANVAEYAEVHHLSAEAAGHEVRYQAFAREMRRIGAQKLALGHHLNDCAESVLMHIISGCSPAGLVALQVKQNEIIRPLANVSKADIIQLCAENHIPYRIDQTNYESICLRNKLRLELLPVLRKNYNPQIDRELVQLSQLAAEDEDYFNAVLDECLPKCTTKFSERIELHLTVWQGYHLALKRRILQKIWQEMSGEQKLSFAQIEQIIALAQANNGAKMLSLPAGWYVSKEYAKLIFSRRLSDQSEPYCFAWESACEMLNLPVGIICRKENGSEFSASDNYQAMVDADKLSWPLIVRNRLPGDRMRPLGSGEKKIKDILIDKKIPQALRAELPLIISAGQVVWLAGVAVSEDFKVTAETKNICHFAFVRNE